MTSQYIETLVATIGVEATAERLLRAKTFEAESEEFFLARYQSISWRNLLPWLARPEPDEEQPRRPIASVIARIVDTFGGQDDLLLLLALPGALRSIHRPEVREEIIDALLPKMDPDHRYHLSRLAEGCETFTNVRDR